MTRRSWLRSFGLGDEEVYFFGLQLVIHAFGEDTLRARFAEIIADPDGTLEDTEAKRRYIKRVVALLLEQQSFWSEIFWDYKVGHEAAEAEFESWAAELSASSSTVGEELGNQVDGTSRLSSEKDFVALTVILKLSAPYPPAEISDEAQYWTTETARKLVQGLLLVNPETILADGIFIIPGNSQDGLSKEDLLTGGWSYLRVLT